MKSLTLIVMFLVGLVAPVAIPLPFKNKNLPSRTGQSSPQIPHRGFIKTRKITKCRANVDCSPGVCYDGICLDSDKYGFGVVIPPESDPRCRNNTDCNPGTCSQGICIAPV
ncbi:hypothetical protein BDV24DRAFT_164857 [Aspergillus arachidicola]|uniref:Uncharacterized protein n=1 Tax=Aspergillus arachidicola TaxID=656916 RepID=A0A5N6Y8D3_9EURO|nr:hypothetical protein BDV24DRAFT_164857 [Aspergillus arachidicola]